MKATHFGLRQRPFPVSPDSAAYYPSTCHERAVARLLQGLGDGEGMAILTGEPGSGKTLVCHCLAERLGEDRQTVFLTNCRFADRAALFQAILFDLSLPFGGRGEQEMRLLLTDHLLKMYASGKATVLIADEAHHLSADLLEELRLLGNLETRAGKAIQIILCGLPSLEDALRTSPLAALRQRVVVKVGLDPLPPHEAADYILHHLRIAGAKPEGIVTDDALQLLARSTQGIPRLLNQAGQLAFRLAAEAEASQVDAEAALEALGCLGLDAIEEDSADEVVSPSDVTEEDGAGETGLLPLPADVSATEVSKEADSSCRLFVSPRLA